MYRNNLKNFFLVIHARVVKHVSDGKWIRLSLEMIRDFKRNNMIRRKIEVKMRDRFYACFCPRLKKNRKYLLLGNLDRSDAEPKITINKYTVALRWRNKFRRKLYSLMENIRTGNRC